MTAPERIWANIEETDAGEPYIEFLSDEPWSEENPGVEYTRADIHDRGFANSVDFLQRQGRDADIISEAISTYDEWMLDDDFEAMPVLERIISRMKERRSFSADVATLRAEVERLREAGDRLSFCAQTSGGTAGRDEDLIAAIDRWQEVRATPCACQSGSESETACEDEG